MTFLAVQIAVGRCDPLTGMDACIQPNGRQLPAAFSSAELNEKEARKLPFCLAVCLLTSSLSSQLAPIHLKPFKIIQRPNVPEGTIHLSGFSRSQKLN